MIMQFLFNIVWVLIVILAYLFGLDAGLQRGYKIAEKLWKNDRGLHWKMRDGQDAKTGGQNG
jgi:hypothetical protein